MGKQVDDSIGGNGDGFLDPGESAEILVTLVNFGEPAGEVSAELGSEDPHLEILSGSASFGSMDTGQSQTNLDQAFSVAALPCAPAGHRATLQLDLQHEGGGGSSEFSLLLGRLDYLVWDPHEYPSNGPALDGLLAGEGHLGEFTSILPLGELDRYRTLWISLGMFWENVMLEAGGDESLAIEEFMDRGGCVYLEGGDCWFFDPSMGGHSFNVRFGLFATADGEDDCGPVLGEPGSFCEGMAFDYQGVNASVDHLSPAGSSAELILENGSPSYGLAVAHDVEAWGPRQAHRTVAASFELAGLADGEGISSRSVLIQRIMDFFLGGEGTAAHEAPAMARGLRAWPNPFNPETRIRFELARSGPVELAVFDTRGRRLATLLDETREAGAHEIRWTGRDARGAALPSGVYFARVTGPELKATTKLVLLK